ncbi:NADP-dependent alcohol dehydrogenase [Mariannaea sp. PMI_226]|nr:NADP-dependent alcohol dehydrogenase [Mariannaea sp. PMI_226]
MTAAHKFEGWIAQNPSAADGKMVWGPFQPKAWEETDIDIKVTHCGVCGSDLHTLRSGWWQTDYPCVVGHEIVGIAIRVGLNAEGNIQLGDLVGVGTQADSCRDCDGLCKPCRSNNEPYCVQGPINTYGSRHHCGDKTYGGFALYHRAVSHFVVKLPDGIAPEHAAPMLCAGITVYSPLKSWGAGPGKKVAIAGIGGLGHFAVLFARAMGADEVIGISRKASKQQEAIALGCDDHIATENGQDWSRHNAQRFDLILSTVSSNEMDLGQLLSTLSFDGTLIQVGLPEKAIQLPVFPLMLGRRKIAGSAIGGPKEISEMLQFAVAQNIKPWVEKRPMKDANQTVLDMREGKSRFRYVLVN